MADNVGVSTGTGATVAAEDIGGIEYQRVKLVAGSVGVSTPIDATSGVPAAGSVGLVVNVKPGLSVSAQVSGTVTVSPGASVSAQVSGTIAVNTVVTILSTINVAIVAGAGGGGSVTTAAPSISASGQVVWVAGGQSTTASPIFVSQINPPAAGGGSVTTAAPSITATGQVMWIAGGQSTTANPVVVTGTVTAGAGTTVISGTVTPIYSTTDHPAFNATAQIVRAVIYGSINTITPSYQELIVDPSGYLQAVLPNQTTLEPAANATGPVVWVANNRTTNEPGANVTGQVMWLGNNRTTLQPAANASGIIVWMANPIVAVSVSNVIATTTASGLSGVTGLPVWVANPGNGTTVISGTVTITPTTFTVNTAATISGASVTIQQGASVIASMSGVVVTTTATSGVAGPIVWLGVGQTLGTVNNVNSIATIVTQLGTQIVTIAQTSVVAQASGTITAILPGSTTGSSGMSGVLVWLGASQTILISTQISGTVTITPTTITVNTAATIAGASVTIQQGASVSAVVSGTVTNIPANQTTLPPSVSATGQQIWVVGGQSTTAFPVVITGTVTAGAGTTVVSVSGVAATTTASGLSGVAGMPVWVANPTALTVSVTVSNITVTTVVSGTVSVSNTVAITIPSFMVTTAPNPAVGATGLMVYNADLDVTAGQPAAGATGQVGYIAGTVAVVIPRIGFMMMVSSTPAISAGTTLLFTVWTGSTLAGAGLTQYVVPAGKRVAINAIYGVLGSSASTGRSCMLAIQAAGASGSLTSANQATVGLVAAIMMQNSAVQTYGSIIGLNGYVDGGMTMGMFFTMASSITVSQFLVQGFLEG